MSKKIVMTAPENIPLKKIDDEDAWNRPLETAGAEMEVLQASMVRLGQLEDIIVRPLGAGRYGVISGHRRVAVARELRWPTIRARVVEADDEMVQGWAFATNHARKPVGIFWEAMECRRIAMQGRHPGEVAIALGHSENWVRRRLALDLDACRRFAEEVLKPLGMPIEKVHATNLEMLHELEEGGWKWLATLPANRNHDTMQRQLATPGWLAGEMWTQWIVVQGKPWAGKQQDGGRVIPACEDCPHFGGKLSVLFPEMEALQSRQGCCAQQQCAQIKRQCAVAVARDQIKQQGFKGKILEADRLKGGMDGWQRVKKGRAGKDCVAIVFGGDKSGEWGFYRPIQELPKEAEPGGEGSPAYANTAWEERAARRRKANEAFFDLLKPYLTAEIPLIIDGCKLPEKVVKALDAMRAFLYTEHDYGNFDFSTYCGEPPVRRMVNALAGLLLFDVVAEDFRAEILKIEREADMTETEEDDEVPDDPADEATKGRGDEEDKGDKDEGPRCKHADENGRCANPNMNGGGFVCCHGAGFECAWFEPADDGEAGPF